MVATYDANLTLPVITFNTNNKPMLKKPLMKKKIKIVQNNFSRISNKASNIAKLSETAQDDIPVISESRHDELLMNRSYFRNVILRNESITFICRGKNCNGI